MIPFVSSIIPGKGKIEEGFICCSMARETENTGAGDWIRCPEKKHEFLPCLSDCHSLVRTVNGRGDVERNILIT